MFRKTLTVCLIGSFLFQLGVDLIDYAADHKHIPHYSLLVFLVLIGIGISYLTDKEK